MPTTGASKICYTHYWSIEVKPIYKKMAKTNGNVFSEVEINGDVIDEEFQSPPNPFQYSPASDNYSSEMEYSPSTDGGSLPQTDSAQYDSVIGSSSCEMESSSSITDEESQSPTQPDSVQYDSAIDSSSSSGLDDSTSSADEDNSDRKEALKRETTLGLQKCYPIIWAGDLFLGILQMKIEIRFIAGDPAVSRAALSPGDLPDTTIHIRKSLSFDKLPQTHTRLKMQSKKENCLLMALPLEGNSLQAGHMEYKFIHHLRRKRAVGVVEFPEDTTAKPKYRMLIYPPSDFVYENLRNIAPTFRNDLYMQTTYPHLLCHISPICCCVACEKAKIQARPTQLSNNV